MSCSQLENAIIMDVLEVVPFEESLPKNTYVQDLSNPPDDEEDLYLTYIGAKKKLNSTGFSYLFWLECADNTSKSKKLKPVTTRKENENQHKPRRLTFTQSVMNVLFGLL